jgi:hypothetical protein
MKGSRIFMLVIGLAILAAAIWYLVTRTKYRIGDVLYIYPDASLTFTVIAIRTIDGVKMYVFKQSQGNSDFMEPVDTVDDYPDTWKRMV